MKIISSTDNKFIGKDIDINIKTGSTVNLDDYVFVIQNISILENGLVALSNYNYQLICEE